MTAITFLLIGAQKAGTTSLFEYMRRHPDVYMPPEKEISFFETDREYQRGFDWYRDRVLRAAPDGACCGTASVGYMTGTPLRDIPLDLWDPSQLSQDGRTEEIIPRRIKEVLPEVKLLCVLRDPVERALSHYRMAVLEGLESRSFETAVARLMEPNTMQHARAVATGHNGYIARGEYGRIIGGFLRVFSRDEIMPIFSVDLARNTRNILPNVFNFVGVSPSFVPDNLDKRYRDAALQQRIRGLNLRKWRAHLAGIQSVRRIWDSVPSRSRGRVSHAITVANYRVELWNARRDVASDDMDPSVRQALIAHFRPDSEDLSASLDLDLPWLAAWGS